MCMIELSVYGADHCGRLIAPLWLQATSRHATHGSIKPVSHSTVLGRIGRLKERARAVLRTQRSPQMGSTCLTPAEVGAAEPRTPEVVIQTGGGGGCRNVNSPSSTCGIRQGQLGAWDYPARQADGMA